MFEKQRLEPNWCHVRRICGMVTPAPCLGMEVTKDEPTPTFQGGIGWHFCTTAVADAASGAGIAAASATSTTASIALLLRQFVCRTPWHVS